MISVPASGHPIAHVGQGVFKLLVGHGSTVLPKAFARRHLAEDFVRTLHSLAEPTLHPEPLN
jgi:hypothetical protein